ncbi:hypothetical protein Tco_0725980 [Tanacetum coccineum]|uniref:Uncharacterized protein n=1 Tax=Tanacetum coccineum TaxID=301880 RepID=A0ABQ4YEE7_9ASTR
MERCKVVGWFRLPKEVMEVVRFTMVVTRCFLGVQGCKKVMVVVGWLLGGDKEASKVVNHGGVRVDAWFELATAFPSFLQHSPTLNEEATKRLEKDRVLGVEKDANQRQIHKAFHKYVPFISSFTTDYNIFEDVKRIVDSAKRMILQISGKHYAELPDNLRKLLNASRHQSIRISFDDSDDEDYTSEYDEEEQNVLYFNDLFPFNIIHPDDLKPKKDNDDKEIDIIQSSKVGVNRVHILDFEGLTPDMRQDLAKRMRMVYTGDDGQDIIELRVERLLGSSNRYLLLSLGLHIAEEMAEDGFGAYWLGSERLIPDKGDLSDYWVEVSSGRDFLRGAPSYTYIRDPVQSMDRGAANVPYLLAKYLFRHAEGRKSGARLSGDHFIGRLAHHFGLVSDDGLRGLSVMARELPLIDMGELVKLNICMEIGDDWAWVAPGPERQQVATADAPEAVMDGPAVDEDGQAVSALVQTPQQPP